MRAAAFVVRTAARRDRVLVAVWAVLLTTTVYVSADVTPTIYPTPGDRVLAAEAINRSGALVALYGPILDVGSLGELAMTKLTVLYALAVVAVVQAVVRRHTRAEEEDGRTELMASTAVTRSALLAGALGWGAAVALGAGALAAAADVAGGLPVAGSLAFGASWAGVGLVAVGLTALSAQLTTTARATAGLVVAVLAAWFAVRALADVVTGWTALGWLSPLGWSTRLHAWSPAGPHGWVLLLWPATAAVLVAAAVAVERRRDLGSGVLGERRGPDRGRVRGAASLAVATTRGTFGAWVVAMVALGGLTGALAPGIGDLLSTAGGQDVLRALGGAGALEDAMIGALMLLAGLAVTGWGVAVVARAGADERAGRVELLLATPTRRSRTALVTAASAVLVPGVLLAVAGTATAFVLAVEEGGLGHQLGRVLPAALAPWPAAAVLVAAALLAWAERGAGAVVGWTLLALSVTLDDLGVLLHLPGWVVGLSAFHHVPTGPGADRLGPATLVPAALALGLSGLAVRRFCGRDLR